MYDQTCSACSETRPASHLTSLFKHQNFHPCLKGMSTVCSRLYSMHSECLGMSTAPSPLATYRFSFLAPCFVGRAFSALSWDSRLQSASRHSVRGIPGRRMLARIVKIFGTVCVIPQRRRIESKGLQIGPLDLRPLHYYCLFQRVWLEMQTWEWKDSGKMFSHRATPKSCGFGKDCEWFWWESN